MNGRVLYVYLLLVLCFIQSLQGKIGSAHKRKGPGSLLTRHPKRRLHVHTKHVDTKNKVDLDYIVWLTGDSIYSNYENSLANGTVGLLNYYYFMKTRSSKSDNRGFQAAKSVLDSYHQSWKNVTNMENDLRLVISPAFRFYSPDSSNSTELDVFYRNIRVGFSEFFYKQFLQKYVFIGLRRNDNDILEVDISIKFPDPSNAPCIRYADRSCKKTMQIHSARSEFWDKMYRQDMETVLGYLFFILSFEKLLDSVEELVLKNIPGVTILTILDVRHCKNYKEHMVLGYMGFSAQFLRIETLMAFQQIFEDLEPSYMKPSVVASIFSSMATFYPDFSNHSNADLLDAAETYFVHVDHHYEDYLPAKVTEILFYNFSGAGYELFSNVTEPIVSFGQKVLINAFWRKAILEQVGTLADYVDFIWKLVHDFPFLYPEALLTIPEIKTSLRRFGNSSQLHEALLAYFTKCFKRYEPLIQLDPDVPGRWLSKYIKSKIAVVHVLEHIVRCRRIPLKYRKTYMALYDQGERIGLVASST